LSEREHHWEERREQLSALLDNELAAAERAELEAHLQSCATCRAELESLRRARALLRALPQPALPRSFLLPLEPATQPSADNLAEPPHARQRPAAPPPARPARLAPIAPGATKSNRLRRPVQVVRWLSTVAAVLGVLLLAGSVLSNLPLSKSIATSSNAPEAYTANTPTDAGNVAPGGTTPPPASTAKATSSQDQGRATPTETRPSPEATPTTKGGEASGSASPVPTHAERTPTSSGGGFSLSTPGLGLLLLALSVLGFVTAAVLRRLSPGVSR
jgi:hypothetical protein